MCGFLDENSTVDFNLEWHSEEGQLNVVEIIEDNWGDPILYYMTIQIDTSGRVMYPDVSRYDLSQAEDRVPMVNYLLRDISCTFAQKIELAEYIQGDVMEDDELLYDEETGEVWFADEEDEEDE